MVRRLLALTSSMRVSQCDSKSLTQVSREKCISQGFLQALLFPSTRKDRVSYAIRAKINWLTLFWCSTNKNYENVDSATMNNSAIPYTLCYVLYRQYSLNIILRSLYHVTRVIFLMALRQITLAKRFSTGEYFATFFFCLNSISTNGCS